MSSGSFVLLTWHPEGFGIMIVDVQQMIKDFPERFAGMTAVQFLDMLLDDIQSKLSRINRDPAVLSWVTIDASPTSFAVGARGGPSKCDLLIKYIEGWVRFKSELKVHLLPHFLLVENNFLLEKYHRHYAVAHCNRLRTLEARVGQHPWSSWTRCNCRQRRHLGTPTRRSCSEK